MAYEYADYIWNYFKSKIGNDYGVAALMGNLEAESGLNPQQLQGDLSDPNRTASKNYTYDVDVGTITKNDFMYDGKGYGLAQWTFYSRKEGLHDMCTHDGYNSIGSIELACDYLYYELTVHNGWLNRLKNATSIREASDMLLHEFENPADQSTAVEVYRASLGQKWYDTYAGTGETPTPPTEPSEPSTNYTPRLTAPSSDNKYYIHTSYGGLNECIHIANGSVLPNCVGYAWGRAYEIMGERPNLSRADAGLWYGSTWDGYERGQTPKLGAIVCWAQAGQAGHVAVVEEIHDDGTITTSNSGYMTTRFWTERINPNYYTGYDFQGYIYLPIETDNPSTDPDDPNIVPDDIWKKRKKMSLLLLIAASRRKM